MATSFCPNCGEATAVGMRFCSNCGADMWNAKPSQTVPSPRIGRMPEKRRRSSGLRGSFPLNERTINKEVSRVSAGVYVLGPKKDETFHVHFVGRADTDVKTQLKEYIGKYDRFKFEYFISPQAAFVKECQLYHEFGGAEGRLAVKNHPERPQGSTWQCPKCNVYYSQPSMMQIPEVSSQGRQRTRPTFGSSKTFVAVILILTIVVPSLLWVRFSNYHVHHSG